ncbi:MAG: C-GCAxxG-C-C family protein [Zhaonellaceae bacterium]|jgi:C_GCAxxG_C_C family probable redox protein
MKEAGLTQTNSEWDLIKDYFYRNGLNCAESTVRLFSSMGKYEIPKDLIKAMSGFGGGMQRGLTCGAVTASVALLGLFTGRTEPNESREPSAQAVRTYLEEFEKRFGSLTCNKLKADFESKSDEMYEHCAKFVTGSVEIITNILKQPSLGKIS